MMNLKKSANRNKLKFALTIPLIILMIGLNNCSESNPEITKGEFVISGKVLNLDGNPLPGVNIIIKGTSRGTVTNLKGEYTISVNKADKSLIYAFVGLKTKEIPINEREKIVVTMEGNINIRVVDGDVNVIEIPIKKRDSNYSSEEGGGDQIFNIVNQMAEFEGGTEKFYEYVMNNLKYPSQARRMAIEGKVYVEFVVERDGSITDVKLLKGIGAGCDAEAVRVIKESPNWNPGKQSGETVRVRRVIPITFKLGE